jgi:hypothetical protein
MPWFKVDDDLSFHPKVTRAGNAAMGLWVRAGSWSARHLTDGFVPDDIVELLGTPPQVAKLIKVRLWERVEGGYRFHEWNENGRQPTGESVRKRRAKEAERQRKHRSPDSGRYDPQSQPSAQVNGNGHGVTTQQVTSVVTGVVTGGVRTVPTRPDPTRPSSGYLGGEGASPERAGSQAPHPPRCQGHSQLPADADVPPCRACKQLRLDAERSVADNVLGELAARTARRAAIDACRLCDDNGMRETDSGVARCSHPALEAVS